MNNLKVLLLMIFMQGCMGINDHEIKSIERDKKVILKEEGQEEFFFLGIER